MATAITNLMTWLNFPTFFYNIVSWVALCVVTVAGLRWVIRE